MTKPDILHAIGARLELRRAGREHIGRCPFHDDRHPSFYVNSEKQVFLCRACHVGGDVIDFVMRIDDLTFRDACAALGIKRERTRRPKLTAKRERAAEVAAIWANDQRAKINFLIIERLEQRDLADEIGDSELGEMIDREIILLGGFYDGLKYPGGAAELLTVRASLKQITEGAEVAI
jgi:DNA primase